MRILIVGAVGTKPICGTENSDSHKVGIYVTCLAKDVDIIQIYVFNIYNMHIYMYIIQIYVFNIFNMHIFDMEALYKKDKFLLCRGNPSRRVWRGRVHVSQFTNTTNSRSSILPPHGFVAVLPPGKIMSSK